VATRTAGPLRNPPDGQGALVGNCGRPPLRRRATGEGHFAVVGNQTSANVGLAVGRLKEALILGAATSAAVRIARMAFNASKYLLFIFRSGAIKFCASQP